MKRGKMKSVKNKLYGSMTHRGEWIRHFVNVTVYNKMRNGLWFRPVEKIRIMSWYTLWRRLVNSVKNEISKK